MSKEREILKKYYGYSTFRKGQETIIQYILDKKDTIGIMPTGGGKSLCYQIPAMCLDGIALIISPLISLMKDQVDSLRTLGIQATYINSSISTSVYYERMQAIKNGQYKLIYVAPERLEHEGFIAGIQHLDIQLLAIDEAHCVSQWGHDFRPSYQNIVTFINGLKIRPVVAAFTATATKQVKQDIVQLLGLREPKVMVTGFDRENLKFMVVRNSGKLKFVLDYLKQNREKSGIIYCATRKEVDKLYQTLMAMDYKVSKYHAGLTEHERKKNQEAFIYDTIPIMIATNAFGMGIDKSNVRYVIHYNMPQSMEAYYQEAGRAGRDGEKGECLLLFAQQDVMLQKYFIEELDDSTEERKKVKYAQLQKMIDYCYTTKCLRAYILEYFGDVYQHESCHNCTNCEAFLEEEDITIDAQKIFSCIVRMNQRFGITLVAKVLKGSASKQSLPFKGLTTYGIMKDYRIDDIKEIISILAADQFIKIVGDKYPILVLSQKAKLVLKGESKVFRQVLKQETLKEDTTLFEQLRDIRRSYALQENVPPFVIFSDATLMEITKKYPLNKSQLLDIKGVGEIKYKRYGETMLKAVQDYVETNNIEVSTVKVLSQLHSTQVKKEKKEPSHKLTVQLYHELKDLHAVSKKRNIKQRTVEEHIIKAYREDKSIDIDQFIPKNQEEIVLEAIEKVSTQGRLRPIKELLPEEITYFTIKAVIAKHIETV